MRRLLETLIIECFEEFNISHKIKNSNTNEFMFLSEMIPILISEKAWNIGRNTKRALPKLKNIGDMAAHNRRYNSYRQDVDKHRDDFRIACEELLYISKLKK